VTRPAWLVTWPTATAFWFASVLVGCRGSEAKATAGAGAAEPKVVTLATPTTLQLEDRLVVTGVLAAQEELELGFQVEGRLRTLAVDVGDVVEAGAVLAALEPADFELELARARAALTVARVRLSLPPQDDATAVQPEEAAPVREAKAVLLEAELARERVRELVQQQLGSQANLDTSNATVGVAQSRLQAARDQVATWIAEYASRRVDLATAQKRTTDSQLLAPFAGRVAVRRRSPGSYLRVGDSVLTLLRTDPLRLRLRVPERQAFRVAADQRVEFSVDGGGDVRHQGLVRRLGPSIDLVDRTQLVEAEVENAALLLRPGAFCRAEIVVATAQSAVAIPQSAVASFAGVDRVFVVLAGTVKDRLVELGRRQGDLVEVRRGLGAEQPFVTDPRGLVPGAPVRVRD
jgi:RND family efflux transporter MFP subunit